MSKNLWNDFQFCLTVPEILWQESYFCLIVDNYVRWNTILSHSAENVVRWNTIFFSMSKICEMIFIFVSVPDFLWHESYFCLSVDNYGRWNTILSHSAENVVRWNTILSRCRKSCEMIYNFPHSHGSFVARTIFLSHNVEKCVWWITILSHSAENVVRWNTILSQCRKICEMHFNFVSVPEIL